MAATVSANWSSIAAAFRFRLSLGCSTATARRHSAAKFEIFFQIYHSAFAPGRRATGREIGPPDCRNLKAAAMLDQLAETARYPSSPSEPPPLRKRERTLCRQPQSQQVLV